MSANPPGGMAQPQQNFEVDLPGGGRIHLQTMDEVDLWEDSRDKYLSDYKLTAQSDRLSVGTALLLHLEIFRAQQRINGMEPQLDPSGIPTGQYVSVKVGAQDRTAALNVIIKSQGEIREIEKALGIDKKTRDQGGQYDVASYIKGAKLSAREYGVHLSKRYQAYESTIMAARVKLRMLRNLDAEDLATENLTPESFLVWMEGELAKLEAADIKFAHEKGKLIVGRVK